MIFQDLGLVCYLSVSLGILGDAKVGISEYSHEYLVKYLAQYTHEYSHEYSSKDFPLKIIAYDTFESVWNRTSSCYRAKQWTGVAVRVFHPTGNWPEKALKYKCPQVQHDIKQSNRGLSRTGSIIGFLQNDIFKCLSWFLKNKESCKQITTYFTTYILVNRK